MLPVHVLPTEIKFDILELIAKSSTSAALNLCLLSSNTARSIRPILYRKVVLLSERQARAFAWTLQSSSNFSYTRTLWILDANWRDTVTVYDGMHMIPTKCENLEELAGSANLLRDCVCQLQGGPGKTLAAFPHLKRLCIFLADNPSHLPIISGPITHLHLIDPSKRFIDTIQSNIPPSLHSVTSFCLESFAPDLVHRRFASTLLCILPSITSITVKLDVTYSLPDEVEQIASGLQALSAKEPRLSVKLNTIMEGLPVLVASGVSMTGRRVLHAVDESSNEWAWTIGVRQCSGTYHISLTAKSKLMLMTRTAAFLMQDDLCTIRSIINVNKTVNISCYRVNVINVYNYMRSIGFQFNFLILVPSTFSLTQISPAKVRSTTRVFQLSLG